MPNAYINFASEADIMLFIAENALPDFLSGLISFNGRKETHLFAAVNPLGRPLAVPYKVDETVELAVRAARFSKCLFMGYGVW